MRYLGLIFFCFFINHAFLSGQNGNITSDTLLAANYIMSARTLLVDSLQFDKSLIEAEKAIQLLTPLSKQEQEKLGNAFHIKALALKKLSRMKEAEQAYITSIEIREGFPNLKNFTGLASCLNDLADIYFRTKRPDEGLALLKRSIGIRETIFPPYHKEVVGGRYNLALFYFRNSKPVDARNVLDKIIADFRGNPAPDSSKILVQVYRTCGIIWGKLGDYDKAFSMHAREVELSEKVFTSTGIEYGHAINNLGVAYRHLRQYDKAIDCYSKSLDIKMKNGEDKNSTNAAIAYGNIGTINLEKEAYDKALEYIEKAVRIYEQDKTGNSIIELAFQYDNSGIAFQGKNDYKSAIQRHKKALSLLSDEELNSVDGVLIYYNIGECHFKIGESDSAVQVLNTAWEVLKKIDGVTGEHAEIVLNKLGEISVNRGELNQAIQFYKSALEAGGFKNSTDFSGIYSPIDIVESLKGTVLSYSKKFSLTHDKAMLDSAMLFSKISLKTLEGLRKKLGNSDAKLILVKYSLPMIESCIMAENLPVKNKNNSSLFSLSEKSRGQQLYEAFVNANAKQFGGLDKNLIKKEADLRSQITVNEKIVEDYKENGIDETDTAVLKISNVIFDLRQDYETLQKRFETDYPDYYRLKYDLSTVSLQYVQDTLLAPEQALLEYFVGDSSIYLFVVRPDTFIVQEVKRDFPLDDWIEQLRQGIYGYYTAEQSKQTDALKKQCLNQYLEYAPKLYQKLFAPVAQYLPKRVVLVPDGPLGYIPFDALLTEAPIDTNTFNSYPYLFKKCQFSYTYSATLLKEMCDKKHHRAPTKQFAAFAPFYNGNTTQLTNMYTEAELLRKDLQPLVYSGAEVAAAAKLMRGEIVAGSSATEARFTNTAGNYRILHLATHGRADNRVGDYAFLAFTEVKDSVENELLYVKDLYNLELNADMVVLSACETGIGKLQRGEGIISLARAFAYAGAKSILTTLWEVNDKSTSELMRYFYRELRKGKSKDASLHAAREAYFEKATGRSGHPFFWAAFVPVGDMRPVFKAKK